MQGVKATPKPLLMSNKSPPRHKSPSFNTTQYSKAAFTHDLSLDERLSPYIRKQPSNKLLELTI